MIEIPDSLRLLFETTLEAHDDRYVISIPPELVENSSLSVDESYRVALLPAAATASQAEPSTATERDVTETASSQSRASAASPSQPSERYQQTPPVEEGEIRSVTIDTLGDQGDGIAKVKRGFILIVPGTQPGDQVDVEITDVKETVAFAEPVSEATVR
ncbi:TRAM domain-containing protein [Halomarina halobia]|uniref:TRAM domain-containing protein n=1 Tax=Halomarina halobia TaxID=3033386 RepID=A0ABD6ACU6_9EURY|nr:TRAM domain-containing protein [Halomarina sp. PSR21]